MAGGGLRLGAVQRDGDDIYWLEGRPREGGRYALVRRGPDGRIADVTPAEINVRTRVHEYGGGAYLVRDGVAYCVNFSDQRIYRVASGGPPEPITPAAKDFYADFEFDQIRQRLICVREEHTQDGEPINTLVGIPLGPGLGPAEAGPYERAGAGPQQEIIASGYDFYSTPRLSPDGSRLAWLSWRHPLMPWDGTELWVADVDAAGALSNATLVAGSEQESIYQPGWAPDGALYFVSDRDGWWRIYADRSIQPVIRNAPADAEFGRPQWVFETATWAFAGPARIVVSYTREGRWHLGTVDTTTGMLSALAPDVQPHEWLTATAAEAVLVAGFDAAPDAVVSVDLASGAVETLRTASTLAMDPGDVSVADAIEFPTTEDETAHAFYYAPRNKDYEAPPGEAPPLIVISHGGPTSAAHPTLDLGIQYWTTRGFAVVDVNYRGSTGYGRAYRERLNGRWGIVDVADVISAARFLSGQADLKVRLYDNPGTEGAGSVDRRGAPSGAPRTDARRLIIRGGSAGGYTTLAALTFHPGAFQAGASYYGISDLEVLELDTHKFESRYSHGLIGPYPQAKRVYYDRSPIHAVERLACPLILFQGLEDKVVPPNQSEMMADAVRAKGLPVAYLAFDGEQHGFRKAETIIRSLEAELYFYGAVFGFTPADRIAPVEIANL